MFPFLCHFRVKYHFEQSFLSASLRTTKAQITGVRAICQIINKNRAFTYILIQFAYCMSALNQQTLTPPAETQLRIPQTPAKRPLIDESYLLTTPVHIIRRLFEQQPPKNKYTGCNCSKSQCLKMYCACFSTAKMCDETCLCQACKNNSDNMDRSEAINQIIDKDPHAFSRKGPFTEFTQSLCNCKKSACMKKYCDCYRGGKQCGISCNCVGCCNREKQQSLEGSSPSKATKLQ